MTTTSQKQEILRSLNTLDAAQSEKVLRFIQDLLNAERSDLYQQYLKRKALDEIGRALKHTQHSF